MKFLTFTAILMATTASAQTHCASRNIVVERLASQYSETRQSIGIGSNNSVIEVYAADGGSWTIILTMTSGVACVVASGQAFENTSETLPPDGEEM